MTLARAIFTFCVTAEIFLVTVPSNCAALLASAHQISPEFDANSQLDTQEKPLKISVTAESPTSLESRPWDNEQAAVETESMKTYTTVHGTGRDDDIDALDDIDIDVLLPNSDSMLVPTHLQHFNQVSHFFTAPFPGETTSDDFHVLQVAQAKPRRDSTSRSTSTSEHESAQLGRHLLEVAWKDQETPAETRSPVYTQRSQTVTSVDRNSGNQSQVPAAPDKNNNENQTNLSVSSSVDKSGRLIESDSIASDHQKSSKTSTSVSLPPAAANTNQRSTSSSKPAISDSEKKPQNWMPADNDLITGRSKQIANYRLHLIKLVAEPKDQDGGQNYWDWRRDEAYYWSYAMATLLFVFIMALPIFLYYFFTSRKPQWKKRHSEYDKMMEDPLMHYDTSSKKSTLLPL